MKHRREVIGDATLILGDCREVEPSLQAAAIVCDPPYGMGWDTDSRRFSGGGRAMATHPRGQGRDHLRITGDTEAFDPSPWLAAHETVLWGANHYFQRLPVGRTLIWIKKRVELFGSFLSDCEVGWATGGHGVFAHYAQFPPPTRALESGGDPSRPVTLHPTQKPISLMRWCIDAFTKADIIVDPFMGIGTTGVAALMAGRRFTGIEIHEPYFNIACRRIEQAWKQPRLFADRAPEPTQEPLL